MGQTEYAGNFVDNLFLFLKQLVSQLSKTFQTGASLGGGALSWFASNWLKLVLVLVAVCVVVDWLVWMIRWRPYWLWFRKKRIVVDDDYEDERFTAGRSDRQYHSRALQRRNPYARYEADEDEFYEPIDGDMDDEDDDYIVEDEVTEEPDEFDELLRNTLVAEDADEEDPFADMAESQGARRPRRGIGGLFTRQIPPPEDEDEDVYEDEDAVAEAPESDEFFEDGEPEDEGDDLFFDEDALNGNSLFPMADAPAEVPVEFGDSLEDNPWRTGYTAKVPKIDINSPELSRKMRRRLKSVQNDDEN